MRDQTLNAVQVGAMLVSTSCGVGFLLGTGEQAMVEGMAGCLYAVATALGLTLLAACAPTIWRTGRSIWSHFNWCYGPSVGRNVAVLSVVWMTGVLAAQIRGCSAVLALMGLSRTSAEAVFIVLLLTLSVVRLSWLSVGFACCLIACNVLLLHSLIGPGKIDIWLTAPATFANAIHQSSSAHTGFILLSVAVMVVCGADYQQFAIAARTSSSARSGSLIAATLVLAMGFLLVSAVVAARQHGDLQRTNDPIQVVPVLLMRSVPGGVTTAAQDCVVFLLVGTALGSASSVLRAMSDAAAIFYRPSVMPSFWPRASAVLLGIVVASRPRSLVDMMVELNLVYLAAVTPLLVLSVLRISISDRAANAAMALSCSISLVGYLIRWQTNTALSEAAPLLASIAAAFSVVVLYRALDVTPSGDRPPDTIKTSARSSAQPSATDSCNCSRDADGG